MFRAASFFSAVLLFGADPAFANYKETVEILRIGMLASHPVMGDSLKQETVRKAYSDALGIPVEIIGFPNQAALIDANVSGRVTYAIHTARSFAVAQAACSCVAPVRSPVDPDGTSGFRSVLAVRDSVQKPVAEMRIAFPGRNSVSGYIMPEQAILTGALETPMLMETTGTDAMLAAVEAQTADGFFGWIADPQTEESASEPAFFGGWNKERVEALGPIRIVWSSEPVPFGPHALHGTVPGDLADAIAAFLDAMRETSPGLLDLLEPVHGGGFLAPDPEAYRVLRPVTQKPSNGSDFASTEP